MRAEFTPPATHGFHGFFMCQKMVSYTLQAELEQVAGHNKPLADAVASLFPFDFTLTCKSPSNNYQLTSGFDDAFDRAAQLAGWKPSSINTPPTFSREHDGCFDIGGLRVVVEIEKANWEKFLYDLLKCHVYVSSGADGCLILLPVNWPHSGGIKDIYGDCLPRLSIAREYNAVRADVLDSLVVVGFRQMYNGSLFDVQARAAMREDCERQLGT